MLFLPQNCYCSDLKVHPKGWKTQNASIKKEWYIYYRFYDPIHKSSGRFPKGKLVIMKGMNHFQIIGEKRDFTCKLMEQELVKLKNGFNPIQGLDPVMCSQRVVLPDTGLILALKLVQETIKASPSTKRDLKSIIHFVEKAATILRLSDSPVGTISRRHIRSILTQIEITHGISSHRFNKIRSYLMMLFKELIEFEAIDSNTVREIGKMKGVQRIRRTLTPDKRVEIDKYLKSNHFPFWTFTHIFFHSGARLTEMMKIKASDVNFENQTFRLIIEKGRHLKEVLKPIKDIALPFWKMAVEGAQKNDYVFSKGLRPGNILIQSYQITKRWNRHIKKKLQIEEDFYSLKHLNLDEIASAIGINEASQMASHSTADVTLKYYTIGEETRRNERLKKISNKFA